jgi:hypothetical protein
MEQDFYKRYQNDVYLEPSHNVLNQEEQLALNHYLETTAMVDSEGYKGIERRSERRRLDSNIPIEIGSTRTSTETTNRGRLIKHFQDFAPMSYQEGMTILDSVKKRVGNAEHTRVGEPEAAVEDRYHTFMGYILDASHDRDVLYRAAADPQKPDIALIRTSHETLEVIAKQLMARRFLWDGYEKEWPSPNTNAYKERYKYWLGFSLATSKFASDESMVQLYEFAKSRADKRFREWARQIAQLENIPIVKKLIDEGKIDPVGLRRLWQHKVEQSKVQEDTVIAPSQERPAPNPVKQTDEIDEEYDREFEKLAAIMTPAEARRILRQRGIGHSALSEEVGNPEYDQELADIALRARNSSRPKRSLRGRLIGRALDTADSDKRVETERRMLDY